MFVGKIYPKRTANPEHFKQLGCAILAWRDQEDFRQGEGIVLMVERHGLDDLLAGRRVRETLQKVCDVAEADLPRSFGPITFAERKKEFAEKKKLIRADLLREAHGDRRVLIERVVQFQVLTGRDTKRVIDGQTQVIPSPGGTPKDMTRTVESLRRAISVHLVQEILIDGRSWNSSD